MIEIVKIIYRLLRYKAERKKQWREIFIKLQQNKSITELFNSEAETIIIFLTVGAKYDSGEPYISGGMISIISLSEETEKLFDKEQTGVICCTQNKDHLLLKFNKFENKTSIFRFSQLKKYFKSPNKIIIHIPELFVESFYNNLCASDLNWLKKIENIHFNILNQSISLMPNKKIIASLKCIAHQVTITTAHQQYCTQHFADFYQVPVHKFSVWISPENYKYTEFEEKEDIILFSPDAYEGKEKLEKNLKTSFPSFKIITIQNLTYNEYKQLISKAKFAITFGEGLDGYLLEPVFSGTVAFAVYNEEFFTPDFKILPTLYSNYEKMADKIVSDIIKLDTPENYNACNNTLFDTCAKHYSYKTYQENIKLFYEEKYTYP